MINKSRNLLWLVPLLLFITSPAWQPPMASFLKPRGSGDIKVEPNQDQQTRVFKMDSLVITMSTMGEVEWVINAKQAFTGKNDKEIKMTGVDAVHFGKNKEKILIKSDRGIYLVNKRHLTLIDNVVVSKPSEKQVMYSNLLHYYDLNKMVISPGKVKITAPDFTITAGRMDYDIASDGYDLSDHVICEF